MSERHPGRWMRRVAPAVMLVAAACSRDGNSPQTDASATSTRLPIPTAPAERPTSTTTITTLASRTPIDCRAYSGAQRIRLEPRDTSRGLEIFGDTNHGAVVSVEPDDREPVSLDISTPQGLDITTNVRHNPRRGTLLVAQGASQVNVDGVPATADVFCAPITALQGIATNAVNDVINTSGLSVEAVTVGRNGQQTPDPDQNRVYDAANR